MSTQTGSGNPPQPRSRLVGVILSLLLPGLGQVYQRDFKRGISIFFAVLTSLGAVAWYGKAGWYVLPALLWLWNGWDAWSFSTGKSAPIGVAVLLWLTMAYGIGWRVTEIDPLALFRNQERTRTIMTNLAKPDFLAQKQEELFAWAPIWVPCPPNPPKAENSQNGWTVRISPDCAQVNETVIVTVEGLWPNTRVQMAWVTPIGSPSKYYTLETDDEGKASTIIVVPPESLIAAPDPTLPLEHRLSFRQNREIGGLAITENGMYVIKGIYETLALALLATALGALLAIPISFLAAHNLMRGNPVTMVIYYIMRMILNIARSVEALIMAIVFVIIVGLGPFAGMLAVLIHTIAALGKLYSEVIEGIDPGPIEAIRATGANWLQIVRYAVIPQIVPPFTALTIYRWDINVRTSTIVGFVGGGGIGFFITQWLLINDYRAVSAAMIAIALVVMVLDFFSARLREGLK